MRVGCWFLLPSRAVSGCWLELPEPDAYMADEFWLVGFMKVLLCADELGAVATWCEPFPRGFTPERALYEVRRKGKKR